MILGFGLMIGIFIAVIGIYATKVAAIDNYNRHKNPHVIHFSEYNHFYISLIIIFSFHLLNLKFVSSFLATFKLVF
jgi:hypothetical protein